MITIIDYGIGNLGSVANALTRLGEKSQISGDPAVIKKATVLILPGVGAAKAGMKNLKSKKLDKVIIEQVNNAKPFLGICLGMQLLFDYSEEGGVDCLGILKGKVKRFRKMKKIPQIGWNQVTMQGVNHPGGSPKGFPRGVKSKLFDGIKNDSYFYFVNSYYCIPEDKSIVVGKSEYGEKFASMIVKDNIVATQFHPEKSGKVGFQLLKNFLNIYVN